MTRLHHIAFALALTALVAVGCGAPVRIPARMPANLQAAMDAVAVVSYGVKPAHCGGVFVTGHRVVTAAHCVGGPAEIVVSSHDSMSGAVEMSYPYTLLFVDADQDLAILEPASSAIPSHGTLDVAMMAPSIGDPVVAIGHPLRLYYSVSSGIVSAIRETDRNGTHQTWIQSDTNIWFGNSGGALINVYGELVGVASFIYDRQSHLGFWVDNRAIRRALSMPEGVCLDGDSGDRNPNRGAPGMRLRNYI